MSAATAVAAFAFTSGTSSVASGFTGIGIQPARAWHTARGVAASGVDASSKTADQESQSKSAASSALAVAAAAGIGSMTLRRRAALSTSVATAVGIGVQNAEPAQALNKEEKRVAALFEVTTPSVVSISKSKPQGSEALFGAREGGIYGSGFVWDAQHVVTNFHVISGIEKPFVTFLKPDEKKKGETVRTTLESVVVGSDAASDVAVLRVGGLNGELPKGLLKPLPLGTSNDLLVGQDVFAFGNPFGLEHSLSRGIISGVSRTMEGAGGRPISGVIQTDASINPGNSGGPLLNSDGQVIGVNTAILTGSGTFAGVGLAIPNDTVKKNVESIIAKGFVRRPFLGIVFAPDVMSEELQLNGIMVMKVVPGGPAEAASVRPMRGGRLGDIVVAIDEQRMNSSDDLFKYLDQKSPGDTIKLQVQRAAADSESDKYQEVTIGVKLGQTNYNMSMKPKEPAPSGPGGGE